MNRSATLAVFKMAVICLCLLRPSVSLADTLPASTAQSSIYDSSTGKTLYSPSCISENQASACALVSRDSSVEVAGGPANLQSSAVVNYNFEILGPPQTAVPLIIQGDAITHVMGQGIAVGGLALEIFNNSCCTQRLLSYYVNTPTADPQSQPFTLNVSWTSDFISTMVLTVGCVQGVDYNGVLGSCHSKIDPTIMIDPTFADASKFTLIADAGGSSATPEPCTLTLLGGGLAALAARKKLALQRSI